MAPTKQAAVSRRKGGKKSRKQFLASIRPSTLSKPVDEDGLDAVEVEAPAVEVQTPDVEIQAPAVNLNPELSASASKLQHFSGLSQSETYSSLSPTTIVDLNCLQPLFEGLRCSACRGGYLRLQYDSSKTSGFAVFLYLECNKCAFKKPGVFTSMRLNDSQAFIVNRATVSSSLASGSGYSGLQKLCEFTNMPLMNESTFQNNSDKVCSLTPTFKKTVLEETAKIVRDCYKKSDYPDLKDGQVFDITVSYDGSWHTRGHSSNNGVGAVIDTKTGLVVDYHVMSRYCKLCATVGEKKKGEGERIYQEWIDSHRGVCGKNFDQTAGAMEIEAALTCWGRSERQNGMRYTSVISDGDCKTIKKINELKPYGDKVVTKKECINHISKRLGKALRDTVESKKKLKITLGGKGVGKLTQVKMNKLQKYYTKAIRGSTSVEGMKKAVWATFYHCTSTDDSPHHFDCPDGLDSWCFFRRALARGEDPPSHANKLGSYLCPEVAEHIREVYEKLTDTTLLERCLDGKTQNANESLHNLLWSRCPKTIFVCLKRLETSLAIGIAEFNQGSLGTQIFLRNLGLGVGNVSICHGLRRDRRRIYFADYAIDDRNKVRREQREKAKQREQQELFEREEEREGGRLYLSGGDVL